MDRRIQKTRQLIMCAFIDLLGETGFEKMTINDIANRANVNRGTVYLHYMDKYDLLDKCVETHVNLILNQCDENKNTGLDIDAFQSVFEYIKEHFAIYKLLLSHEGAGYFRKRLYEGISKMLTQAVLSEEKTPEMFNETTVHFLTSGFIGVVEWWIQASMPCPVEVLISQLLHLLEPYGKHLGDVRA